MFALVLSLASITPLAQLEEPLIRNGEHFQLICHVANEVAADQALAAVEATWEYSNSLLMWNEEEDLGLLKVHLHADAAGYEKAEQELTGGAFKRNLAFSHFDTMTAHVALQPPLNAEALAALGLPAQTLRLLAHESAHLIRYAHFSNYRSHPGWLADGSASWIDEQVSRDLGLLSEVGTDPNYSSNLLRVQQLIERGSLPSVEEILLDELDDLEFFERYDVRWLFFRFMLEGKSQKALRELMPRVRRLGGSSDFAAHLLEGQKAFTAKKLATLDKRFKKYVKGFEPAWEEVYRALYQRAGRWIQSAFKSNAIAWRCTPVGKDKYRLAGELTILPSTNRQMNLLLGRCDAGFVSVAFTAGTGVTVFEYLSATSDWQQRGFAECEAVRLGQAFEFSAQIKRNRLRVVVNGVVILSAEIQTIPLDGPWGLGAQSGSTGVWKLDRAPGL